MDIDRTLGKPSLTAVDASVMVSKSITIWKSDSVFDLKHMNLSVMVSDSVNLSITVFKSV